MDEQEKIVERIRKLAALRESPNEHEAALAAAKMQEVLFKYNLDISVLRGVKEDTDKYEKFHEFVGKDFEWKRSLIATIAKTNFCKVIGDGSLPDYVWIVGKKHNKEVVNYLYEYLTSELERLADIGWMRQQLINLELDKKAGVWARTWKKSFLYGAVEVVRVRLEDTWNKSKIQTEQTYALVTTEAIQLNKSVRDFFPRLTTHSVQLGRIHQDGYSQGKQAGANVGLNRGIENGSNPAGRRMLG